MIPHIFRNGIPGKQHYRFSSDTPLLGTSMVYPVTANGQAYAAKLIDLCSDDAQVFDREARLVRALKGMNHPNLHIPSDLVKAYDPCTKDHYGCVITELLGGDLLHLLESDGLFTPEECVPLVQEVSSALTFLHSMGIIHRDAKVENILFDQKTGMYKLFDFGIVYMEGRMQGLDESDPLASIEYFLPEMIESGRADVVDESSDVHTLATTLTVLLTGYSPFNSLRYKRGASVEYDIIYRIEEHDFPTHRFISADIPQDVITILEKALQKKPADRFSTPREFSDALVEAVKK